MNRSNSVDLSHWWCLTDGHAGNLRQARALLAALGPGPGCAVDDTTLIGRAPWRWAAPRCLPGARHAFGPGFAHALAAAPPALAVGCGRQSALATRLLRRRGARVVQILDPRLAPRHWDIVVTPAHDRLRGENVVTLLGSLHPVDDAWLDAGRRAHPALGALPGTRTALLLGGPSAHADFDLAAFERLAGHLATAMAGTGGALMGTVSRRTPTEVGNALRARFAGPGHVAWLGPDDGPNPYAGLLGWADRIVCTADSVNMLSEACATRAPVFVFEPDHVRGRPRGFVDALLARGRIRDLRDGFTDFAVEPLRETARVADAVRARLGLGD